LRLMQTMRRRAAKFGVAALATLGLAGGMLAMSTATASAASYNGVCGSSYAVIDSHGITGGTIFLTYSSSTGKNCVVTVRNTPGSAQPMTAEVSLAGQPWNIDSGNYTTYAGPVYVSARNQCIDWGGSIGSASWDAYSVHCG
jgi:hypothetical protein